MNKIEIHPLSAIIGAALAFLLLFACSSSGKNSDPPAIAPIVTTQVTFYSDAWTLGAGGPWNGFDTVNVFSMGTTAAPTVITDVSWISRGTLPLARLLVNGAPVYVTQAWTVITHGILVPAGAVLTVEAQQSQSTTAYSLAGYTL